MKFPRQAVAMVLAGTPHESQPEGKGNGHLPGAMAQPAMNQRDQDKPE